MYVSIKGMVLYFSATGNTEYAAKETIAESGEIIKAGGQLKSRHVWAAENVHKTGGVTGASPR